MRAVIPNCLWIGNALDARDLPCVLGLGIEAVVDLAAEEPPVLFPRELVYCRFPLVDGAENSPALLRAAIETTIIFITSDVPTLVACGAGMSRSLVIVAAALAIVRRVSLADALRQLAGGQPHDISPSLVSEVERAYPTFRSAPLP
jgi:protein-tyrosine phosphatase